ncbi:MAG: Na+/H+ antiporter NhaA [Bdellovibrionaceae bacterium]|nr:Na+/H+ antiporter NhaA [Pseudobdellovibrionaceae bacterium]
MAAKRVVKRIFTPIEDFLRTETSSGVILMLVTIFTLIWANSPFYYIYHNLIELPVGFAIGDFNMTKTLHHWVNDGLMVIFFFVVGLEIKRELIQGELSSPKKAALPMFAALGGMIFPALIYASFNHGGEGASGWGIPMATDIAFAVGVLSLMSKKVPFSLKIFLLALAIVDDLGAVLVIAFFYTDKIVAGALGVAIVSFALTYLFRIVGVRNILVYVLLGIIAWFSVLKSGVHSTIAGVILGLMTPLDAFYNRFNLSEMLKSSVDDLIKELNTDDKEDNVKTNLSSSAKDHVYKIKHFSHESISPLDRLVHTLHPWVSFLIMPIFAFVNSGIRIEGFSFESFVHHPISLGVILGLLFGKPIGVLLFTYLAVKLNFARLPRNVSWFHMTAVGFLAGIGFTMALFVAHLALETGPILETYSKLGILSASLIAGAIGSGLLSFCKDVDPNEA